jgi:type I restriction-modification system DNA methylase subunit
MGEELLQRDLIKNPQKIGKWDFYNIGNTTLKTLKDHGIVRKVDYGSTENKKVDGLIVLRKAVIAVVEYKKPSEFRTVAQQNKAINQEIEVAKKLGCKIFIATDTKDTVWVNALTDNRIKDENGQELKINFNLSDDKLPTLIEKINFSINEKNDQLKPKELVNPTDLAKQIWQDIWSVSGATPENCLYTFVELFIFKYLSDLGVLQGIFNFDNVIRNFEINTSEEILENYAGFIRPKIKELFPESPSDKTTIINGTIFVSKDQKAVREYSTVFKKVLLKFKEYGKLEHIDYDFKSQLFESFLKESISKKNWGQFFTPLKVVRAIVEMAKDDVKEGIKICDPACGVGKFLLEPIITKLDEFYEIKNNTIRPKIEIHGFDKGFDKDEQKTIILAKANMLIYFSDLIKENSGLTKNFSNLFNDSFTLKTNSILGTLSDPVENEYDLILTNPPYVTSGSSNLKEEIKKDGDLINHYKINALGVEGLFMEWIIKALKPNGKAFIIIPDGILNRQNDKHLRKYIIDTCFINGLISLPLNTFFTTNKKTYILSLTKKANLKQTQEHPVFTYLVSEIGETRDVNRFDIDINDLQEAVTLYSFFKGNKVNFDKINADERCKILPFIFFQDNFEKSWIIDRLWTEEERIRLGIIDKNKSVDLFGFASMIEDISTTIGSLQEEIKELSVKKKSEVVLKSYKLSYLFNIVRGSGKYIKRYIDSNKGDFPVYSGNTKGRFASINTYDYNQLCLSWAIDGLAGYIMIHDERFSATNHRGVLLPKFSNINLFYAKYILEPIFRDIKKGRLGSDGKNEYTALPPFMIKDVELPLPIDENGDFDFHAQTAIVEKFIFIDEIKQKIRDYKQKVTETSIEIDNNIINKRALNIDNIFDLSVKTNSSKFTKAFINKHKGNIPVYSASKFSDSVDYGYVQDNLKNVKYFENCLTWNIDGSIGQAHFRKGRFSLSEKVIPLIIKGFLVNSLDIEFLKYSIEFEFSKHFFGFNNKAGKGKIKNIKIDIPLNDQGDFDLRLQREIANELKKIADIKTKLIEELEKIDNTNVIVDI